MHNGFNNLKTNSLNPCFCGSTALTLTLTGTESLLRIKSLNPCFCGSTTLTKTKNYHGFKTKSLNPCFCGSTALTLKEDEYLLLFAVRS